MLDGEALVAQQREGLLDHIFVVADHRLAARFLIAGVHQRVDGERVVFRRGDVFFEQRAEDADFGGVEGF